MEVPLDIADRLAQAAATVPPDQRGLLACIRERAVEESGWAAINAQNLDKLRAGIGDAPLVELPFYFVEEFRRDTLDVVSRTLEAGVRS